MSATDTGQASGAPEGDLPAASPGRELTRRPRSSDSLTQEQLERVIRRASDLQFRSSTAVSSALDPDEVLRIGEEVGLEPRYVQQAIAEVQAEALVPTAPEDGGFVSRWAGSAMVRVSRVVPGDQPQVEERLGRYLREKELMKPVRTQPGRSLWEPAGGLVSSMRRAMDVGGHGYTIAKAKRLQVAVEPLEKGWCLVTLTADMSALRNEAAGGWLFGFGLGSLGLGAALVVVTGGAALAFAGGGLFLGGGVLAARRAARLHVRKERERMELMLLGLLDRLERGEKLGLDDEPWHQKLLRSAGIAEE